MVERRQRRDRRTPEGFKIRNVHMQPETVIRIVPPGGQRVLDQEDLRVQQDAELGRGRKFFYDHAPLIAFSMAGEVEDADRIDSVGLRAVTLGLRQTGLGVSDLLRSVSESLRDGGYSDGVYSRDAVKAYGTLLADDRARLDAETAAAEGAPKPPARAPRAPRG